MGKIDLKDAYYTIPVRKRDRKYLRFLFNNDLYEFECLPFGLSTAPFVFTKLLKPACTLLRSRGIYCVIYLDDFLILADTAEACREALLYTRNLIGNLGFIVNLDKSILEPDRVCQYLGYIFDSIKMTISLPFNKVDKIISMCNRFSKMKSCKIRDFAELIGFFISCCPTLEYGFFHTKTFEREKFLALEKSNGNYEERMVLTKPIHIELIWWLNNSKNTQKSLRPRNFILDIFSDASLSGWGAACNESRAHGFWNQEERNMPINILELKAAFFALKCFANDLYDCDVLLRIDNTVAISHINRMGGIKFENLNRVARDIWSWCENRKIWIFRSIQIDLFATRINTKCKIFVSWFRDPNSLTCDAFTISWKKYFFYAFPPFAIILKVLRKIMDDKATGIMVIPNWPSQAWYPLFESMRVSEKIIFEPRADLLISSNREPHPLWRSLTLTCAIVSGGAIS